MIIKSDSTVHEKKSRIVHKNRLTEEEIRKLGEVGREKHMEHLKRLSNDSYEKRFKRRFESKLDNQEKDKCWNWTGWKDRNNYGFIFYKDKMIRAHRVSWLIYCGDIPDNMHVLHKCDNPSCVNPEHLFLGDNYDNIKDKMFKNRSYKPVGEKCPFSKLTWEKVDEIRRRVNNGEKQYRIAREFGISRTQVSNIMNNKHWKDKGSS